MSEPSEGRAERNTSTRNPERFESTAAARGSWEEPRLRARWLALILSLLALITAFRRIRGFWRHE